ncbi:MAG: SRPBCC family protein [Nitrososphaerota archaeon]|nr:SRPBCC family protein [Nitrososphaerota archaeon]
METVHSVVEIAASPQVVYETLTNTSYIIKIFRDAVSVDVDPPGNSVVGQKYHLVGRAGRRKIDINLQVAELVPNKKVVTVQRPGGVFKSFKQTTVLESRAGMTEARTTFEYELAFGYIGKVLNSILVERLIRENLEAYSYMVKELSELLPMPSEETRAT